MTETRRHLATRTGSDQRGWAVYTCKAGDFRAGGPDEQARAEFDQHRRDKGETVAERKVQVAGNVPVAEREKLDELAEEAGWTRSEYLAALVHLATESRIIQLALKNKDKMP